MPAFFFIVGGVALGIAINYVPKENRWIVWLGYGLFFGLISIASAITGLK